MTTSETRPLPPQEFSVSYTKLGTLLDDICFQNGIYKHSDEYGTGTPILRITDFDNHGRLTTSSFSRVALSLQERDQYAIRENDIIINRVNSLSHIGKSMLVPTMHEYPVFESNMMRIRISDESPLAPEYVAAVLQAEPARRYFRKFAKPAVAQASINQDDVRAVTIVLHPKPVQRSIAKALLTWDIALEKAEQLIAAKERHYSHELSRLFSEDGTTRRKCRLGDISYVPQEIPEDPKPDGVYVLVRLYAKASKRTNDRKRHRQRMAAQYSEGMQVNYLSVDRTSITGASELSRKASMGHSHRMQSRVLVLIRDRPARNTSSSI